MTALHVKLPASISLNVDAPKILKLTRNPNIPSAVRDRYGLLTKGDTDIDQSLDGSLTGFGIHLSTIANGIANSIKIPEALQYLDEGDVIKIDPRSNSIRTLFRRSSRHNFFLFTERCNHYCLMCSQPPKDVQDDWLADDMLQAIPLIDRSAEMIGITGGEPTLLGRKLLSVMQHMKAYLPNTALYILSNGRSFADKNFVDQFSSIGHPNTMVAIPLYSDLSEEHDYVVQADGAFDETIRGILELKRRNQKVEIRIVIHKATYERLPHLAEFIYRNLSFVDHVALMGLELTGFAKANISQLWIDPLDYKNELKAATLYLSNMGMNVSVFNHQLCTIDESIWRFAERSISDWKNEYDQECNNCRVKNACGGFFTTSTLKRSRGIKAIS